MKWHLVRAECALDRQAIYFLRTSPALGGAQNYQGPARSAGEAVGARLPLDLLYPLVADVEGRRELLVNTRGIVAFHSMYFVAKTLEQRAHVVVVGASQHRRVSDLISVEMQDGEHHAI